MVLRVDPEFELATAPWLERLPPRITDPNDIEGRRKISRQISAMFTDNRPLPDDVQITRLMVPASDGYEVPVFRFSKKSDSFVNLGPAILHMHGGAMVMGDVKSGEKDLAEQVQVTGVQIFSVEYRLAPEHRHPTLVEDCYASLLWLHQNANAFGVDPTRIAVMGESAGGGIAAGVSLLARDRALNPPLAKQILIYPMLDDRNATPNLEIEPFAVFKTPDNIAGWRALLGEKYGTSEVSPYAAPARVTSLAGLPATYIDIGGLDIFRDENVRYAARIAEANVPIEFHLYPGVPHGFDGLSKSISVTKRALENRRVAMTTF